MKKITMFAYGKGYLVQITTTQDDRISVRITDGYQLGRIAELFGDIGSRGHLFVQTRRLCTLRRAMIKIGLIILN